MEVAMLANLYINQTRMLIERWSFSPKL